MPPQLPAKTVDHQIFAIPCVGLRVAFTSGPYVSTAQSARFYAPQSQVALMARYHQGSIGTYANFIVSPSYVVPVTFRCMRL